MRILFKKPKDIARVLNVNGVNEFKTIIGSEFKQQYAIDGVIAFYDIQKDINSTPTIYTGRNDKGLPTDITDEDISQASRLFGLTYIVK